MFITVKVMQLVASNLLYIYNLNNTAKYCKFDLLTEILSHKRALELLH